MWFRHIDKLQFRIYVRQDARLNRAYWLASKAIHMRETLPNTKSLERRLSYIRHRTRNMLSTVHEDLPSQIGLTKQLSRQQLEFTTSHCVDCFKIIDGKLSSCEDQQMARELKYIRDRADIIPEYDLMEEWDRGIYLMYQAMAAHDKGVASIAAQLEITRRMDAACELMEPGFERIQRHCRAYIKKLSLNPSKQIEIVNQQIIDYSRLFSVGLELANFSRRVMNAADRLKRQPINDEQMAKLHAKFNHEGNIIQTKLIDKSLARTENLRKVLDQECYVSLPKPVQTTSGIPYVTK